MGKILLVENTNLVSIKFKRTLEKYGYELVESIPGPEFYLGLNETEIKEAALIFIDGDNRENNTEKLIEHIKKKNKQVKIVTITSQASHVLINDLYNIGSDDVLAKPFSDIKLMEKVFKYLNPPTSDRVGDTEQKVTVEDEGRLMPDWNEDLELGLESVDKEHKELIERYESLYQKMKSGEGEQYCIELIGYLENYVETHFKSEEKIFASINFGEEDKHKVMHNNFCKKVAEIAEDFRNGLIDNQQQVKFNLFIKNWWMHHILIEDRKHVDHYNEHHKKVDE